MFVSFGARVKAFWKKLNLAAKAENNLKSRAVESELEGILGGDRVGKNVPTPTLTSI
jgi:hypothetical protein